VGTNKLITVSGYSLDGAKAGNYSLLAQPTVGTANITGIVLTITDVTAANKAYDGNTTATLSGGTLNGVLNSDDVTIFAGTGSFADVNVGSGKTVTATGYTLGGTKAGNYILSAQPTGITADITKGSQTITFDILPARTFGDESFDLTATASSGLAVSYISSDESVATVSGNTVTIVGIGSTTITASQAGNGTYLAATSVARNLTINSPAQQAQTITFDPLAAKTYGNTTFDLTATASSGLPVSYFSSDESVATVSGNTVTIIGSGTTTITASQAGNIFYGAATSVDQILTVNKKSLTITGVAAANKTYDGTITATLSGGALNGIINSDNVTIVAGSGAFVDANVGTGKTVTAIGYSLNGAKAGNYILSAQPTVGTANITAASLTIIDVTAANKTYDGTDVATLSGGTLTGIVNSDEVTIVAGTGAFVDANVGTDKTVTATGYSLDGSKAENYILSAQPTVGTANITAVSLTITNVTAANKTYNGTDAATLSGGALTGVINSDDVTIVAGTGKFADANVGTGKTVTATGYSLDGSKAGNYTLSAQPIVATADITGVSLTITGVTASNKTYDGTTTATLSGGVLNGIVNSDNVTIVAGAGAFVDANVGTGKSVTATGYSLDGSKAGNYILSAQPTGITADIIKANQTIVFGTLPAKTLGDVPFTISATGGASGNAVTFSSSDESVATVSGTSVTIVASGSCTIYANQTGNSNYNAAEQVGQLLEVSDKSYAVNFTTPTNGTLLVKNGSAVLTSGDLVLNGTILTVTATPSAGYVLSTLTANSTDVVNNSVTVSAVTTIAAAFTIPTWTGSTDTDWNTATNWMPNVVPTALLDVIIPAATNEPFATDNSVCRNLTINSGAVVTIPAGKSLTVSGSITNNAGVSGLVIKSSSSLANGTLIFNNAQNAPVPSTVEMYSKASWNLANASGDRYKWQFFGVPVRSLVTSPTFTGAYVRHYDESQTALNWVAETSTSTLLPFKGYEIAQEVAKTYILKGDLVNADFSQTLVKTDGALNAGRHVLANPYTAAVDIKKLNFGTQTEATVYLYNTGSVNEWASYEGTTDGSNPGQYTSAPASIAGVGGIPAQIPSMQGFVVKAMSNDANATFGMPYSSVVTKNVDMQRTRFSNHSASSSYIYSIIDIMGAHGGDRMWLFTSQNCTRGFDNSWDGRKMFGSALAPQLFARETDGNYQVDAVNDVNNTELGFQAGTDTEYTLRFTNNNIESVYNKLYLLDYVTGSITDITANGTEYRFTSENSSNTTRFKIVSSTSVATDVNNPNSNSGVKVYSSNKTLYVQNMSDNRGDLMVCDVTGRFISKLPFEAKSITTIPVNLVQGVYIVTAVVNNQKVATANVIIP